jgi:RNA polymerase sigma-70 factor (ECF subfamily)
MAEVTPDSAETQRLLDQVRAGEPTALGLLLARHRPFLYQFVELRLDPRVRPRVDPSDVVQDAQLEATRRVSAYLDQPVLPFRLWLRRLAHDQVLMLHRAHLGAARRAVQREVALPERSSLLLAQQLVAAGSTPSEKAARQELARRVSQAVGRLSEADREVLLMRTFEGLSFEEVACVLGIDPAAARKRHGRAILRLHKLLTGDGLTESQL